MLGSSDFCHHFIGSHNHRRSIRKNTEELMSIPGVVGIGQGLCDGARCIKVLVIERTPEIEKRIPDTLEGYRVEIDVTGRIRAQ